MDDKLKLAIAFNLAFVAFLILWPLLTAPPFQVQVDPKTVKIGGTVRVEARLPLQSGEVRLTIKNLNLNRTVQEMVVPVNGGVMRKEVKLSPDLPIGTYAAEVTAGEKSAFSIFYIFGGENLTLEVSPTNKTIEAKVPEGSNVTTVSQKIEVRVLVGGKPLKGVKVLAVSKGANSTVTEVAYTNEAGEATLDWSARVSESREYEVIIKALKPGHPVASAVVDINVKVEKG